MHSKTIWLVLPLAAMMPFGCKCLSAEPSQEPVEQVESTPSAERFARQLDPGRPRMLDPKKARMLKFGDRHRLVGERTLVPAGSGTLTHGTQASSQPSTQPSTSPATAPASSPPARPGKTR